MTTLTSDQTLQRAMAHYRAGELLQAEQLYRTVLQTHPDHPDANHNLGVLAVAVNKIELALPFFKLAVAANPNQGLFWLSYIGALMQTNQLDAARTVLAEGRKIGLSGEKIEELAAYLVEPAFKPIKTKVAKKSVVKKDKKQRRKEPSDAEINQFALLFNQGKDVEAEKCAANLTKRFPNHGIAWKALGVVLYKLGRLEESLDAQRKSLKWLPNDAETLNNLGNTFRSLGRLDEAEKNYRQAIARNPRYADAYNNLAVILQASGHLNEAEKNYRQAIAHNPNYADAYNNLGNTHKALGYLDEAEKNYRQAITHNPNCADTYNNLAVILYELGRLDEAEQNYLQAITLNPNCAEAYINLGMILKALGRLDEAEKNYRQAIVINPDRAEAHSSLGHLLKDQGRLQEAEDYYRTALRINPDFADAQSNLLFTYNYTPHHSPEFCLSEAKRYGALIAKKVTKKFITWQCESQPKRLRIGFVSGDFRDHVVSYFLENLLTQLDATKIELIAYSTHHKTDAVTERIKPYFTQWKPIFALNDKAAAQLIHNDGVAVLVDLSGHTAKKRLPLFAWKPAPIQLSWLGYLATTGVAEIDYILVDEVGVPAKNQWHFTEKTRYLPDTCFCFSAPKFDIAVTELPALSNGYITFGCFQNLTKVTDATLVLWGQIFAQLPTARLRFQSKQLRDKKFTEQFYLRLATYGIHAHRVSTHGTSTREDYLSAHSQVDLILDTFPYTGCTTTCEALWMGVPTLTQAGETLLARQGASILSAAGLPDWIANNPKNYVEKALTFATNVNELAKLRAVLRTQVLASPLFDSPRFARNFEHTLEEMWREYQAQ